MKQRPQPPEPTFMLRLRADVHSSAMVTSLVEKAGQAFGLPASELYDLMLATEEIFAYVAVNGRANPVIDLRGTDGGYYMAVDIRFNLEEFDPKHLNVVQEDWPLPEEEMSGLGLLIASRSIDRLSFHRIGQDRIHLNLIKYRPYDPAPVQDGDATAIRLVDIQTGPASDEEIRLATTRMIDRYGIETLSRRLRNPGMVQDMAASGDLSVIVARDSIERLGGVIYWLWRSDRVVEFFGPFVFDAAQGDAVSDALIVACINDLAKSEAIGLYGRYTSPQLPTNYFEELGGITTYARPTKEDRMAWFRLMKEDPGAVIWADASVLDFLNAEYDRLALAREIHLFENREVRKATHSVLTTEFDRARGRAVLRPVWPGTDAFENVARHRDMLLEDGLPDLMVEIDLGVGWQASFLPGLADAGFKPRIILPLCGEQDILLLQYER